MNPYEVLIELQNIPGKKDKIKFLKRYDSQWLRDIVKNAIDPFITFGIKKYTFEPEVSEHGDFEYELGRMAFVLNELSRRSITGNQAFEAIKKASAPLNSEQRYVFSCILDKDLKCGVSTGIANKAFPGLIPVWKIQKANKIKFEKVVYPCVAETKENGRGNTAIITGRDVKHYSNNGKENPNMNYFDDELTLIAQGVPCVIFGEVRGRKGKGVDHFKKSQSLGAKNADMTDMVFVIWDMLLCGEFKRQMSTPQRTQEIRSRRLKDHLRTYQMNYDKEEFKVRFIKQKIINSQEELERYYAKMLRQGYEGLIVKNLAAPYEYKRTYNWMKMKQQEDKDLKIVGVKQGKGKLKGTLGSVTVKHGKKKVDCPCGKGVNREVARKLWKKYKKNKKFLIGKIAEISYQNETPDGSLFLPKFVRIRDDK